MIILASIELGLKVFTGKNYLVFKKVSYNENIAGNLCKYRIWFKQFSLKT